MRGGSLCLIWLWRKSPTPIALALTLLGILIAACTPLGTHDRQKISAERLRTPEGYAEWKKQFDTLNARMEATRDQYARDESMDALHAYERAVRGCLEHGFALYRATNHELQSPAGKEALVTLLPYLNTMANRLMDVAEEYVKHRSTAMGNEIASDVITYYTDLPLLSAQERANTLLFQNRYRRDF